MPTLLKIERIVKKMLIDEVVSVMLYSGKSFDGPITSWSPREGFFKMASTLAAPGKVLLREVHSAMIRDLNRPGKKPESLISRAMADGWDGEK